MRQFAFPTTWGAHPNPEGGARFRLWAPAQKRVSLVTAGSDTGHPMRRGDDGWFELDTDAVPINGGYLYELENGTRVPDPAARAQTGDVHGPSRLVDPGAYEWRFGQWPGRAWHEAVVYELHCGAFTPEGTFDGIAGKLDYLADLGVTAIEIMPVAQFSGSRGWGYDGVLLYAPHTAYGGPEALKRLVDAAHERRLMVLLDVVYNHFGPDGNYLHLYAPEFFDPRRQTPWGSAIAYEKGPVREFFIENALYWLNEFRLDGLRLDAINQIEDQSGIHLLEELGRRARAATPDRHIHLTTEDDRNIVRLHQRDDRGRPKIYTAEWNDDVHHAAHVTATGERDGYYQDYGRPVPKLARGLAEGYIFQGEHSIYWGNAARGEPSTDLPGTAFIDFLQNHDQIGNRAFGERLASLAPESVIDVLTAILLLSPHIPLMFMGEEWGERRPFCFFTDFEGQLADLVRKGRRDEFKAWPAFRVPEDRDKIPDPNAIATFTAGVLDWAAVTDPANSRRLELVRRLLRLRASEIAPRLTGPRAGCGIPHALGEHGLYVTWSLDGPSTLTLVANLGQISMAVPTEARAAAGGRLIYESGANLQQRANQGDLPEHSAFFCLSEQGNE